MARIAEDELQRLKEEVPLARLAQERGVELKRHGADLVGRCPFHDDKEPSLVITPEKRLWHCLGACQAGGSVIDWVMKAEGVVFRRAVELLRAGMPALPTQAARRPGECESAKRHSAPLGAGEQEMLQRVVAYYHEQLKQSPQALGYLAKRGLTSAEMVACFKLGYACGTLARRLSRGGRQADEANRRQLIRLGVLRESGREHFDGAVTIPILDERGEVLGMYGRRIAPDHRAGSPVHLYLPGRHRGVFNVAGLERQETVILCEALIDALTFWCAGFRNVTSSYGAHGFTDDHLAAFRKNGVRRLLIAYDRDDAGDTGARRLGERLSAEGFEHRRVCFPQGMDANEYAMKAPPAERSLGLALEHAG